MFSVRLTVVSPWGIIHVLHSFVRSGKGFKNIINLDLNDSDTFAVRLRWFIELYEGAVGALSVLVQFFLALLILETHSMSNMISLPVFIATYFSSSKAKKPSFIWQSTNYTN